MKKKGERETYSISFGGSSHDSDKYEKVCFYGLCAGVGTYRKFREDAVCGDDGSLVVLPDIKALHGAYTIFDDTFSVYLQSISPQDGRQILISPNFGARVYDAGRVQWGDRDSAN